MQKIFFVLFFSFFATVSFSQKKIKPVKATRDTLPKQDTLATFQYKNQWIDSSAAPQKVGVVKNISYNIQTKSFTIGVILLFIFGIINLIFNKYVKELWKLSFKSSFRTNSLKAQLSSNKAASLFMNIFFCIITGVFLHLILQWRSVNFVSSIWLQLLLCIVFITLLYLIKYVILYVIGVVFQQKKLIDDYIFIVFLCNKLIGMLLLPVVSILLITTAWERPIIIVSSFIILLFFMYRYFISYTAIAQKLQMQKFHFFIYLCSVEVIPLLVLYKIFVSY